MVAEHPKMMKASKQRVFGYTAQTLAAMTGRSCRAVRRAVTAGKVDLGSLDSVCRYLEQHRG